MNDRTNYSAHAFGAIAASGAAAAASDRSDKAHVVPDDLPPELLSLNDRYAGGRWTDRHWEEKNLNPIAVGQLADVEAALMGLSAVTRLLSRDEVHAEDARTNSEQVTYSALCPTMREGLRFAQEFMLDKALFAIESVRTKNL